MSTSLTKNLVRTVFYSLIVLLVLLVGQRIVKTRAENSAVKTLFWISGNNSTATTVKIEGELSRAAHAAIPEQILDQVAARVPEIRIELNTPGGSVDMMLSIMNAMDQARANGIRLVCTVTKQAASAGFLIFNHCDKRYAHELANLMWHSVSVYLVGSYNLVALRALVSELEALQYWGNSMIQAQLKLPPVLFSEMWLTELTLTAPQLKALAPHYLELIPYVAH
jgi:ATP-dependent protease ClpP protease subunit